jgi:hypothetical protein
MKKWIFLDIDGVLATNQEFYVINTKKFWKKHEWAKELKVPYPWNKKAVEIFNEILDATDAEIILSSDWKKHWTLEDLDKIFKANGVKKSPIAITGNHPASMSILDKNRASDIEAYLRDNKFIEGEAFKERATCSWVVIDDLYVGTYFPEQFQDRVFLTNDVRL